MFPWIVPPNVPHCGFLEQGKSVSMVFPRGSWEHQNQITWWFPLSYFNANIKFSVSDINDEGMWEKNTAPLSCGKTKVKLIEKREARSTEAAGLIHELSSLGSILDWKCSQVTVVNESYLQEVI